ncbi:RibD family protein [Phycicoccus sonneratiae]|uniref:RibD family protein n=1 Tax=Phycicoccus sonneratiae TaxID=2807628 RepID=A0ABS2CHJ1_9MICO|nr:dihydrofolate reductase family protein [Phycicoccus sonneraticus]MBM6399336.1 RibD family protein [Phycicoccus sonneraticus]
MDHQPRPRVVLTTLAGVDGRITLRRDQLLLDPAVGARWRAAWPDDVEGLVRRRDAWIADHHAPTVTLEGSGSFVRDDVVSPWAEGGGPWDHPDHLPRRAPRWFVVVDGRGRMEWTFTGDDETALMVLVCRSTPPGYLEQLHELGVGWLACGDARVDLDLALRRLRAELGVRAVRADGGGGVNGALLRAGLVDELHVVTMPVLVGGLGTPTFLDGEPLAPDGLPVGLRVVRSEHGEEGSVWTHYEVVPPAG